MEEKERMKRLSIVMLLCLAFIAGVAASAMASFDFVGYQGGSWVTNAMNTQDYVRCCVTKDQYRYVGVRKDNGIDYVYNSSGVWYYYSIISGTKYRDVCNDAVSNNYLYCAKVNGGLDVIYFNGTSWVVGGTISTAYYTRVVADRGTQYCVYGAKKEGGIDKIAWNGAAWVVTAMTGSTNLSINALSNDGGVNGRIYGALGCDGGLYAFQTGSYGNLSPSCYAGLCADHTTSNEVYGVRCDGWVDGIVGTTIYNLLSGIYATSVCTDRTTSNEFYDAASTGPDCVWYAGGWTHGNLGTSNQYTSVAPDAVLTKTFCATGLPAFKTSTINFSNLTGVSSITIKSRYYGAASCINRDFTPAGSANWAYDYTVSCIKDTSVAEPYRLYWGGRFKSTYGDGDHVLQAKSKTGLGGTWYMPHPSRPEMWQGIEQGAPNTWYYGNFLSPQIVKVGSTYYMYSNCQIDTYKPIDYPAGATAACMQGRLQLATSTDGDNWTRKTDRGVITNINDPAHYGQCYNELIYEANDASGKPWWLYCFETYNSSTGVMYRIKSNDPTTFDWTQRTIMGTSLGQYGNTMGVCNEAPGGHLYARISFTNRTDDSWYDSAHSRYVYRWVPSMEFSRDGINWTYGSNGPVLMDGLQFDESLDSVTYPYNRNKQSFNMGFSLINGINFEYLGSNTFRAIYFGSEGSPDPYDPNGGVFYSEIGCGEVQFTVNP